jgi:tetratricopeptide (TPR) repeat protein
MRRGELPARTVERATATLRANPEDAEAYHQRGHAHEQLGDPARSEADFTEALKRQPANTHLQAWRGLARLRQLRYDTALVDLQQALERKLTQEREIARFGAELALVRVAGPEKLRDAKAALPLAERAVGINPTRGEYRATLALVYCRLDRLKDALKQLQSGGDSKGAAAWHGQLVLALVHARGGDAAQAREALARGKAWEKANRKQLTADRVAALAALRAEVETALAQLEVRGRKSL